MAKKYIDAERLIEYLEKEADKEFKATEENANSPVICHFHNGCRMQALDTIDFIKQLQQEQPCDTCTNDKGCVACKDGELWEGKEQPSKDLEKEIKTWIPSHIVGGDEAPWKELKDVVIQWSEVVARHFYILGLKNNIPVTQITLDELAKEGEPVSKDLEEAAIDFADKARKELYFKDYAVCSIADYDHGCIDGFKAGAEWQKEQMLKDAVEREVKIDSGGYPYIDITAELYDYEHDVPLAKEGELVKIIIVPQKEDME